jgi:nucleoside-diphosphate-sugar epimerase
LTEALRGTDAVVHLAAMMHVWKPLADYEQVNVGGTVNVCRAAVAAAVGRVVHMSSSTVYGMDSPGPVDESFPLAPFDDPYSLTKAKADLIVQRLMSEERFPAVILRPDQIFGPGDRLHFGATAERLRSGRGVVVGKGDNYLPLVYVDDVVQGLMLALDSGRALGEAFNLSSDSPITQREYLACVAQETGGQAPRIRVPLGVLRVGAAVAERMFTAVGGSRRPPITRLGAAFLGTSVRFSIGKARNDLGYAPRISLREGIRRSAAWYLSSVVDDGSLGGHERRATRAATGAVQL